MRRGGDAEGTAAQAPTRRCGWPRTRRSARWRRSRAGGEEEVCGVAKGLCEAGAVPSAAYGCPRGSRDLPTPLDSVARASLSHSTRNQRSSAQEGEVVGGGGGGESSGAVVPHAAAACRSPTGDGSGGRRCRDVGDGWFRVDGDSGREGYHRSSLYDT